MKAFSSKRRSWGVNCRIQLVLNKNSNSKTGSRKNGQNLSASCMRILKPNHVPKGKTTQTVLKNQLIASLRGRIVCRERH